MAAKPQRYLFETAFDREQPPAASVAEPEPLPTYSDGDLAAVREAAFAEGEASGRAAALDSIEKQLLNGLGRMVDQIGRMADAQGRFQRHLAEQAARLALTTARKMLPEVARREGLREIAAVVEDCLRQLPEQPRIAIRVAADMLEPLRPRIEEIAARLGHDRAIVLTAEPGLDLADCRIEWADGGAERLAERIWAELDSAVERIYGAADRAATAAAEEEEASPDVAAAAEPAETQPDDMPAEPPPHPPATAAEPPPAAADADIAPMPAAAEPEARHE